MIICEGETDTMSLWQGLPADKRADWGIVGLSGTNAWKDNYVEELFREAKKVFVLFDNDDPYENEDAAKATEKAWRQIRAALGNRARRVTLPQGINDVAEFMERYDWAALSVLLKAAARLHMNYPRLDLSKEPEPVDWLLDNLIAKPDVTVLYGDGGVSKSLWLMGLAVAIVEGWPEYLGMKLHASGPVYYVDEENPEDVVRARLKKLGLTQKGWEKLYYVSYGGVRLDEDPDRVFDDISELEAVLACFDSFSRLQAGEENEAKEMNRVFNTGLIPITRKLLVPTLALHHVTKEGRMRGSTAIRNAADLSLEVVPHKVNGSVIKDTYTMFPDKARRGQKLHTTYQVVGYDADGGETNVLDEEVRIELERRDIEEVPY